jgi:uncharacterized protein (TIGR03382 family)
MSRARGVVRAGAVAAALALAVPTSAFVRSSDRSTGKDLFWPIPVVPFHVSSAAAAQSPSCTASGGADPALDAARNAFAAWRQGCASLELVYGGQLAEVRTGIDGTHENLVVFRQGFCSANAQAAACMASGGADCGNTYDCFEDHSASDRFIVALTSALYDPNTGRIVAADVEVNGWDGVAAGALSTTSGPAHGWYFTCGDPTGLPPCATYGQGGCAYVDLQNTLTHEVGHFLGLAHPCGDAGEAACPSSCAAGDAACQAMTTSTMFPTTTPGDTGKRTLSSDDVAGVCAIYPTDGGCGCGSAGAPGAVGLLLAVWALRPRRRVR